MNRPRSAFAATASAAPASPLTRLAWGLVALVSVSALAMSFALSVGEAAFGISGLSVPRTAIQYVSYFTILTNLLVAAVALALMMGRRLGGVLRVLLLNGVSGIVITGVVHWFLLRPTADPQGLHVVTDVMQHILVPWLAPLAWLIAGPVGILRLRDVAAGMVFPLAYAGWTLLHGAITGWYPYGFIDVGVVGYPQALTMAGMILSVMVLLSAVMWARDAVVRRARTVRAQRRPLTTGSSTAPGSPSPGSPSTSS